MKNLLMLSILNVWSMDKDKGAPSFYRTIKGYSDAGWDLTLIVPRRSAKFVETLNNINIITYTPVFERFIGIPILGFLFRILNVKHAEHMFFKLGNKELSKYNINPIVYAYEVHAVKAGKKLSKKYKIPFVTRFQGTVLAPIKDTFFNRLVRYPHFTALKTKADAVIMTDDGTLGDKVLKRLKNKTSKIFFWKNGVDLKTKFIDDETEQIILLKKSLGINENEKVLLTVSRLASWKRVDRAIIALKKVLEKKPNCKLVIVGEGDEKSNLQKLAQDIEVQEHVVFVGAISHDEVIQYMKASDIFLSLYDLSNVGNPLLEAMSCGKPIITLNVGDTSSVIKHEENGILLDLCDLDLIPVYVRNILDNNVYANKIGKNARKYAENNFWSWDERIQAEIEEVDRIIKDFQYKR